MVLWRQVALLAPHGVQGAPEPPTLGSHHPLTPAPKAPYGAMLAVCLPSSLNPALLCSVEPHSSLYNMGWGGL